MSQSNGHCVWHKEEIQVKHTKDRYSAYLKNHSEQREEDKLMKP